MIRSDENMQVKSKNLGLNICEEIFRKVDNDGRLISTFYSAQTPACIDCRRIWMVAELRVVPDWKAAAVCSERAQNE